MKKRKRAAQDEAQPVANLPELAGEQPNQVLRSDNMLRAYEATVVQPFFEKSKRATLDSEQVSLLEREHFDATFLDAGEMLQIGAKIFGESFDLARQAAEIARSGPGKYVRADKLRPLIARAILEAIGIAMSGRALDEPPWPIAVPLKKIREIASDEDGVMEYLIASHCSPAERERRIFAFAYRAMCSAHETATLSTAANQPLQPPSPFSIVTAAGNAGKPALKRARGGRNAGNVEKGEETKAAVLAQVKKRIDEHGDLKDGWKKAVAQRVQVSVRTVERAYSDQFESIERYRAAARDSRHLKNSDISLKNRDTSI
jgi:hypothetical protein